MTPEEIIAIITALVQAVPELLALIKGGSATDVQSVIQKYGVDQAVFSAAIAAAKASGK